MAIERRKSTPKMKRDFEALCRSIAREAAPRPDRIKPSEETYETRTDDLGESPDN